ncbi:DUF2306 domain-containing protein [Chryseobacterium camelliae]|uniref:DUF2306 domain-containing protein n=1 Tax=Chryseobacterium camelliae TaxID=1265445 RepID=A0ABY7QIM9_9FLAO|nr:DUF2306 domain-containing protein [Chryseobacterium camelliae]WBV59520.1 DUF2306 domain-containing protein [Chryseobacterium camelliae]
MMKNFSFIIIGIFALLIGAYPLIYVLVEHKHTFLSSKLPEVLQNVVWRISFFTHIIFGGLSLFIGWRQFGNTFRTRHIRLHKIIGKIYVWSVMISSISGIYIGFYANGGVISALGFICLGLIWLLTTVIAVLYIKKGNIHKHRDFMTYSYACTFAAVTLRIWYPLLKTITEDPLNSYLIVAWLCWGPNLIVAYFINKGRAFYYKKNTA